MSDRMEDLRTRVQGEMEAALQDAASTVAENVAEVQEAHGWTDAEIRVVLMEEDEALMQRFRTIGFCPAFEDLER
jgi:hypothetical protein